MPELDVLRNMFRDGGSKSESESDEQSFRVVDITGMTVEGQEQAILMAAIEMDWPLDSKISFEGQYILSIEGFSERLSFKQKRDASDRDVCVVVPRCCPF